MSLKRLIIIGFLASLVACDAIVNKDKLVPPEEPQIPQAVVEAVRMVATFGSMVKVQPRNSPDIEDSDVPPLSVEEAYRAVVVVGS